MHKCPARQYAPVLSIIILIILRLLMIRLFILLLLLLLLLLLIAPGLGELRGSQGRGFEHRSTSKSLKVRHDRTGCYSRASCLDLLRDDNTSSNNDSNNNNDNNANNSIIISSSSSSRVYASCLDLLRNCAWPWDTVLFYLFVSSFFFLLFLFFVPGRGTLYNVYRCVYHVVLCSIIYYTNTI